MAAGLPLPATLPPHGENTTRGHPLSSPGGDELAFVSYRPVLPGDDPDGKPRTFIINRFGGDIRAIGEAYDVDPAWSPDGNWIAVSNRGPVGGLLRLLDPYSGDAQTLDTIGQHPSWSNNSEYVAFHREFDGQTEVYLLNVYDYSEPVLLFSGGHFPDLGMVRQETPTPTPTPTASPTPQPPLPTCTVTTLHSAGLGVNLRETPGGSLVGSYSSPTTLTASGWFLHTDGWQWIYVLDPDSLLYGWIRQDMLAGLILTPTGGCVDLRRVTLDGQTEDPFDSDYDYELPNPATDPWSSPETCSSENTNEAREGCAQETYIAFYNGFASEELYGHAPKLSDLLNRILRLELGTLFNVDSNLALRVLENNYWQIAYEYNNEGCNEVNGCNEEVIVSVWLSGVESLYRYGNPTASSNPLPGFDGWFLNPPKYQAGAVYALSDNVFEGCQGRGGNGPCEWGNYGFIDGALLPLLPSGTSNTYPEFMSEIHASNTFLCSVSRAYYDANVNNGEPNSNEGDVWLDEVFAVTGPSIGTTWNFEMLIEGQPNRPPWLLTATEEISNGQVVTTYGKDYRVNQVGIDTVEDIRQYATISSCPASAE